MERSANASGILRFNNQVESTSRILFKASGEWEELIVDTGLHDFFFKTPTLAL